MNMAPRGKFEDLDVLAQPRVLEITAQLDQEAHTGQIGEAIELKPPIITYCHSLASVLLRNVPLNQRLSGAEIFSRSYKFGIILASKILENEVFTISMEGFADCADNVQAIERYAFTTPLNFLGDRPTLTYFVERYSRSEPQDQLSQANVFIGGGLALLQVEEHRIKEYYVQYPPEMDFVPDWLQDS